MPDFSRLGFLPSSPVKSLRQWIIVVVTTVAVSGLGPILLLAGRGSTLADKAIIRATFHDALVVHVDLSAVAWFLGICLLFWALLAVRRPSPVPFLRGAAIGSFASGCAFIAVSPLLRDGMPLMSNYIPVYTSPLFFLGLGLLAAALAAGLVDAALSLRWAGKPWQSVEAACAYGIAGSAFIVLLALGHFYWAYTRVTPMDDLQTYYELLFWAGGHMLQFAYAQLLLLAWLILASASGVELRIKPAGLAALFSLYPLAASFSPLAFLGSATPYDLYFFTAQMRHGNLAAALLGSYILYATVKAGKPGRAQIVPYTCLMSSFFIFLVGGVIGFLISGSNTIIPAHYHGSIVGTTVAFMGVVYVLLPRLSWGDVMGRKLAIVQPLLYVGGSAIHAIGLAIGGMYGEQRKTVGTIEAAETGANAAMKLARHGGSLAILGGALFVILVVIAIRNRKKMA